MTTLIDPAPTSLSRRQRRVGWRTVVAALFAGLIGIVGILLVTGFEYVSFVSALDRRALPAPGALVDVGGHQLHLVCTGQGSPTVILETGLGASSSAWSIVQPAVASSTRTCAYDRAGTGWSPAGPEPRDAQHIASELNTLLQNGGISGPYVLVGHSNGGLYARMYASMHPSDVAGVVLIEATPADLLTRLPATRADLVSLPQQATTAEWMARFGLARLFLAPKAGAELAGFPTAGRDAVVAEQATSGYWRTLGREVASMETSLMQVHQAGSLGALPLIVLSTPEGAPSPEAARIKQDLEDEMAALSTNSEQQVVPGASHMSFATRPDIAAITIQAIDRIVDAVRSGSPLSQH